MMQSDVIKPGFASLALKGYLFKLRAYPGYFCGLILAQLLALVLMHSSAYSSGMSPANLSITNYSYGVKLVLTFSAAWIFMIAMMSASRSSKNSTFSFPGNRLTDSLSDVAYILTGCLFGGLTTTLIGAPFRIALVLISPVNVVAQGFYPTLGELATIAAGTFLYMLLLSSVGYLSGTLIRHSKIFVVIVPALLLYIYFSMVNTMNSPPFWRAVRNFLFNEDSLVRFAFMTAAVSVAFYAISAVAANHVEVKK